MTYFRVLHFGHDVSVSILRPSLSVPTLIRPTLLARLQWPRRDTDFFPFLYRKVPKIFGGGEKGEATQTPYGPLRIVTRVSGPWTNGGSLRSTRSVRNRTPGRPHGSRTTRFWGVVYSGIQTVGWENKRLVGFYAKVFNLYLSPKWWPFRGEVRRPTAVVVDVKEAGRGIRGSTKRRKRKEVHTRTVSNGVIQRESITRLLI